MIQKGFAPILIVILIALLGIGGYFVYTNYLNNRTKTPSPTTQSTVYSSAQPSSLASLLSSETPIKDTNYVSIPNDTVDTSSWKTYTNANLKFQFKYPPENYEIWEAEADSLNKNSKELYKGGWYFDHNEGCCDISISVIQGNLQDIINQETTKVSGFTVRNEQIVVAGIPSIKQITTAQITKHYIIDIFIPRQGNIFILSTDYDDVIKLFNSFLKTFEFIQ